LWEHLSNQEAVEIVNNHQRSVRIHIFYFTLNASDFMVSPVMNFIISSAK
jgi:hypothetical protein